MSSEKGVSIIQMLSFAIIIFVAIICVVTLFRIPTNLKQAVNHIESAENYIKSSKDILEFQKNRLDSVIITNQNLLKELDTIKSSNDSIRKSINDRLKDANWYLNRIKKTIDKLPKEDFDPQ